MLIMRQAHVPTGISVSLFTPVRRAFIGGLFLGAIGGFAFGNGHTTQNAIQAISQQVGCEHQVASKAIGLAKRPTIVTPSELPKDNCETLKAAK